MLPSFTGLSKRCRYCFFMAFFWGGDCVLFLEFSTRWTEIFFGEVVFFFSIFCYKKNTFFTRSIHTGGRSIRDVEKNNKKKEKRKEKKRKKKEKKREREQSRQSPAPFSSSSSSSSCSFFLFLFIRLLFRLLPFNLIIRYRNAITLWPANNVEWNFRVTLIGPVSLSLSLSLPFFLSSILSFFLSFFLLVAVSLSFFFISSTHSTLWKVSGMEMLLSWWVRMGYIWWEWLSVG